MTTPEVALVNRNLINANVVETQLEPPPNSAKRR